MLVCGTWEMGRVWVFCFEMVLPEEPQLLLSPLLCRGGLL